MIALLLRLEAPLMHFPAQSVDARGTTALLPGRGMLAGLLGNALGLRHRDSKALEDLQRRISYAARWERMGRLEVDFLSVDLGAPHMIGGWTTRGEAEIREGRHRRYPHLATRPYWADGAIILALRLSPGAPDLDEVVAALCAPARPIFIGRKCCIPSVPILVGLCEAETLAGACGIDPGRRDPLSFWPDDDGEPEGRRVWVTDDRDWKNRIFAGRRSLRCSDPWIERTYEVA